jgi:serine/threonine protein kinase
MSRAPRPRLPNTRRRRRRAPDANPDPATRAPPAPLPPPQRQWFKAVEGLGDVRETPRDISFCGHVVAAQAPQLLVVPDTLQDARFAENPLVVGGPKVRFYAGCPLLSSANGYRYGSLCVIDVRPREALPPELLNMLAQFGELVVREIEKEKLAVLARVMREQRAASADSPSESATTPLGSVRNSGLTAGSGPRGAAPAAPPAAPLAAAAPLPGGKGAGLARAADCFREGVLLVDAATPGWRLLYANAAFSKELGVPADEAVAQGFWELFSPRAGGADVYAAAVAAGEPFVAEVALQSIYCQSSRPVEIDFRPAATGQLAPAGMSVGVPAGEGGAAPPARPADAAAPIYYFAIVRPAMRPSAAGAAGAAAGGGAAAFNSPRPSPAGPAEAWSAGAPALSKLMPSAFTDVRLGPLIGRGAYGRVYRASWNGSPVAVKVVETADPPPGAPGAPPARAGKAATPYGARGFYEAVLSSTLSHPNIVHTYQYAVRQALGDPDATPAQGTAAPGAAARRATAPEGSGRPAPTYEVWLVSEFCNRGPLLTAVERGAFLTTPSVRAGQPNLIAVLQTLQEVAAAMQYLHAHDIIHGDLTGGNVLLTASDKDSRGFTAKVVDFGLSRLVEGEAALSTRTMGCAEYMPPELIVDGALSKAGDVYAFGVCAWEVYAGRRAWEGLKPSEVLRRVAAHEALAFPAQTPHRLRVLSERCMAPGAAARPTFEEVLAEVNAILSDTMNILQQFLQASGRLQNSA